MSTLRTLGSNARTTDHSSLFTTPYCIQLIGDIRSEVAGHSSWEIVFLLHLRLLS